MELNPDEVEEVKHGHRVKAAEEAKPGLVRGVSLAGELIAILGLDEVTLEWQPKKVFYS